MIVRRFPENPIIRPDMDGRMGGNINGPSLIRVPDWVSNPLGRYYLYFADHGGKYIRLAYADALRGPWKTHPPGVLNLEDTPCLGHIASPDVHVLEDQRVIRMYYHGGYPAERLPSEVMGDVPITGQQFSFVAHSPDGLNFQSDRQALCGPYLRALRWGDGWLGMTMPGRLCRSRHGRSGFEIGPKIFSDAMRHAAPRRRGSTLEIYHSVVGHCPERIVRSTVDLSGDWSCWRAGEPRTVLEPELDYEGVGEPLEPSIRGKVRKPVRQLRDPAIYEEDGRLFLLYAVAGESGIAIAELTAPEHEPP